MATCLALLLDRGQMDLDEPVCRYWPEFAAKGKDEVLVRDVVCHRSRMPGLLTPASVEEATDDVRMARLHADQPLAIPPSEGPRYHAMTFGWLCGDRRIDGRSVGRFLAEEIAAPLGLDIWIGLPDREEYRVAVLEWDATFVAEQEELAQTRGSDEQAWSIWSNPPRFAAETLAANLASWHKAEIPATNGIVRARSLSRLYGCLALDGRSAVSGSFLRTP